MQAPPLPEGWEKPVRRTSVRPTKMPLGVPMELLAIAIWLAAELWLALGAIPQAVVGFLLVFLTARTLTRRDPWWLEIVRQNASAWLLRALRTGGRSLSLSSYRAPR
ncbi:type IV secretory pathway VirB3-like protein [Azospirillum fermentarium]|uniref:VirB3 family type IV secretion system protein n=1 Tax=Azospirillum fermentarium TaxID=1233114 RepID=UPI00222766C4|nr:VirB3 family type IV secretion system protein [Azospirillum fermentarium]MCW2249281.1 type IV secretory pathway VirB3-like protein [Azospirillum fermentarium]